jgi:hypothetical protein
VGGWLFAATVALWRLDVGVPALGPRALVSLAISCAIVTGLFLWQGWQGFNLYDEGFLWYGAQRVIAGEVPLRDFQSYDPGRYYWSAALMALWADSGIVALRAAVAAFEVAGLTIALLLISGNNRRRSVAMMLLAAVTFSVWMFPRHKLFDITLSIALMAALAFLAGAASRKACFAAGVAVGLVAVFGRNHGVYGVAASVGIIAYLASRENAFRVPADLAAGAAGIVVGYSPMLAMIAFVPGFATAFWESVRFLFEMKATNLPLQTPWPWLVPAMPDFPIIAARDFLVGMFFIAIIGFAVLGIGFVILRRLRNKPVAPELVSCVFLSFPYAHFAFSRPDIGHLSQGMFPLLVGCFVAMRDLRAWLKWPLAALLTAASLFVMLPQQPGWGCRVDYGCAEIDVAGNNLNVDFGNANSLRILQELVGKYSPGDRSFVVMPFWPAAYAVFGRKSPTWEIFALFPRNEAFQLEEIERIKKANPGLVLVWDFALDGNEDLRFHNTHPLVDRFFQDHFDRLPDVESNFRYQIYKSR